MKLDEPITPACIFDCQKKEELKVISAQRFTSIVKATKALNDGLYKTLTHADQSNSIQLYGHRTCVSSYTSKEHIKRALKRKEIVKETVNPGPAKRTRSSVSNSLFDFKKHCIFCGTECFEKDPKNPARWRDYNQLRAVVRTGQSTPFKDYILQACSLQKDSQSAAVEHRVKSALSDLHVMDARHHIDCKKAFFRDGYLDSIRSSSQKKKDSALLDVIKTMDEDKIVSWNSIELENLYNEYGGCALTRKCLANALSKHFREQLLISSSPGVANIFVFPYQCHFNIVADDADTKKNVKEVAIAITQETEKQDRTVYRLRMDDDAASEGVSSTLMDLLNELKVSKLPALLIGKCNLFKLIHRFSRSA